MKNCQNLHFKIILTFQDHPDLVKDQFWDEQYPELPYTVATEETKNIDPCEGATARFEVRIYQVKRKDQQYPEDQRLQPNQ